jgi:hypothetical protein
MKLNHTIGQWWTLLMEVPNFLFLPPESSLNSKMAVMKIGCEHGGGQNWLRIVSSARGFVSAVLHLRILLSGSQLIHKTDFRQIGC